VIVSEWLNSPGPYVQYTYNPDLRLVALIRRFGFAFDDCYWFWIPKNRGGAELPTLMVKRAPLWTYPCKSIPAEKAQKRKASMPTLPGLQRRLLEVPTFG
jgi:hypothetical protein